MACSERGRRGFFAQVSEGNICLTKVTASLYVYAISVPKVIGKEREGDYACRRWMGMVELLCFISSILTGNGAVCVREGAELMVASL